MDIREKFRTLGVDNAPGQEENQEARELVLIGEPLSGPPVDFSHGDVDAHLPTPGSKVLFDAGVEEGAAQAYTPYKGRTALMERVAKRLSAFTGAPIDPRKNLILTPGTQGALFLAMGANIMPGDKVAIVEPDYFANRKLVFGEPGIMRKYAKLVREIAAENHCAVLDVHTPFGALKDSAPYFLYDGIHLNIRGNLYASEIVLKYLTREEKP